MTEQTLKTISVFTLPVLTVQFIFLYFSDKVLYKEILLEDQIVEWLTFFFLFVASTLSLILAFKIFFKYRYYYWFFILFFLFSLLAAFEEISWGQRVFNFETTGIFQKYSDQNEVNLHNTFQGLFRIKTKHIALLAMFFWGFILPVIHGRYRIWQKLSDNRLLVVPPRFMRVNFLIAAIMMLDFQTGYEEEIGELFFSICFIFTLMWQFVAFRKRCFNPKFTWPET